MYATAAIIQSALMTRRGGMAHRLALGSAQFGLDYGISNARGKVPKGEIRSILHAAIQAGIDTIDTAPVYGNAEHVLGEMLPWGRGLRLVTKTTGLNHGIEHVSSRLLESARLLRQRRLYAVLIHSVSDLYQPEGDALWQRLHTLKQRDIVEKIGFSAHVDDDVAAAMARFAPDIVQVPSSILDQRLTRSGVLAWAKSRGIEVHIRSIFLQGLLLLDPLQVPPALAHISPTLKKIRDCFYEAGITPLRAAVSYALSLTDVDRIVVGVTSQMELAEVLSAAAYPMPSLDWSAFALHDDMALNPSLWLR